ncbi:MAG: AtzE family amidohydrolase [Betaproteobacteria bacterium]|nr:AtzE family amidohydrolase [Betaproteobacteria bacterium]
MEGALEIARAVRSGERRAIDVVDATLAHIERADPHLNCFTHVAADRARLHAEALDASRRAGRDPGPLAGVPFAVKNLFDVQGIPTVAGARTRESQPPARADAVLVGRLSAAGAILVGALNMDAYAYGFTTENTAYGATRNPHDPMRIAGGSSGGSGAAVAAGMVPVSLGSDTNGSIRVPASLCGVFGLKPTFGRLPRTGTYPFVANLDHLGPFATTAADLARVYDCLQGHDAGDPGCVRRPAEPTSAALEADVAGLRVARLTGYFDEWASDVARTASSRASEALGATCAIELPEVARARAAAFVITASEGGALRLPELRERYADMEPHSRDRLVAGALTPAAWYLQAQKVRAWFLARVREVFDRFDLLVAPATPVPATPIGEDWLELNGTRLPLRPNMGILTQPISCIGLPVCAVPVTGVSRLSTGVQLIAAPWREDLCLRAAAWLERQGVARCEGPKEN